MIDLQNDSLGFHGDMSIGEAIARSRQLSVNDGGISQAYAFNEGTEHSIYLFDPVSGRNLRIVTDCPSVQVYNAYLMDGSDKGKGGVALNRFSGIALEPQGFPDAPNNPQFPTTLLLPGEVMRVKNTYFFGNGSDKVRMLLTAPNAHFMGQVETSAQHMIPLAEELFGRQEFVDVAYFEPFYLKDFIATTPKKKVI